MTVDPVKIAISFNMAFLFSPKEGDFTTQTLSPALSLLTIKDVKGSDSISSAMIKRGRFFYKEYSRNFKISSREVILPSERRINGFSKSTFCSLASVKK